MNSATREKVVPIVTSDVAGPLGVLHLPRMWAKITLGEAGMLPEGHDKCGQGFDQMTLDACGLDREETIAYIRDNKPSYVQFEQWVVEQNGGKLDQNRVRQHNDAVRGYNHGSELAQSIRDACGVKDSSISDAVTLNKLEDLDEFHKQVVSS